MNVATNGSMDTYLKHESKMDSSMKRKLEAGLGEKSPGAKRRKSTRSNSSGMVRNVFKPCYRHFVRVLIWGTGNLIQALGFLLILQDFECV